MKNIQELEEKLEWAGIDMSHFWIGKAKHLHSLLKEIQDLETELIIDDSGNVVRKVRIVGAYIYYICSQGTKYFLKEDRQIFTDGRERRRSFPVSLAEKCSKQEDSLVAIIRGIKEELGISDDLHIKDVSSRREREVSLRVIQEFWLSMSFMILRYF